MQREGRKEGQARQCKELSKANRVQETKRFGREVGALSSYFILQKLLNDKKIHGKSTVSSEIKDQDCQEPLKEEYQKLRDILQQRDNEISILSKAIGNRPLAASKEGGGTLQCLPLATSPSPQPCFQFTLTLAI